MFSLLKMEAFAEKHERWLHATWVVVWSLILSYVSVFFFFTILRETRLTDIIFHQPLYWIAGVFVLQVLLVCAMMPLVHWTIPHIGLWVMKRGLFSLEPMYYFMYSIQFIPAAFAALLGIPIAFSFATNTSTFAIASQRLWFFLFPILILISIGFVLWKGTWMLEQSGVDRQEALLFFTATTFIHLVASFVAIGIIIAIAQIFAVFWM